MQSSKPSLRQRFTAVSSALFILLGLIILVRSLIASVIPLAVLGVVFIALGVVRIRDYLRWRQRLRGS
jgi:uncharacterized membrane protein HdeD (DUF308 family)